MRTIPFRIIFLALLSAPFLQADQSDAGAFVKHTIDSIFKVLADESKSDVDQNQAVLELVDPAFDFTLMGKLTLGKANWGKLSEEQRTEFSDLFYQQLRKAYVDKISAYKDKTVEFGEAKVKKSKATVATTVVMADENLDVVYKLAKRSAGWRIYDVEVQSISIIRSYGAQYDEVLHKDGPDGLLTKMRESLAENAEEDTNAPAAADNEPASAVEQKSAN